MKKSKIFLGLILMICILGAYLYWGNTAIVTTQYDFEHPNIPESFDGYKIVQVSDLHNTSFDGKLTDLVAAENPDLIVVTGDVIDRNRTNIPVASQFLEDMTAIAPVYFVSGNHEIASDQYDALKRELDRIGVVNLDDAYTSLKQDGEQIGLIGLGDPLLIQEDDLDELGTSEEVIQTTLDSLLWESSADFNLLLAHRPERFDVYTESPVDLAFTGHAHGGQIQLPFIGGLYAPTQGFLPAYYEGMYKDNGTSMIVSRGLGNSIFPFRIMNRPEVIAVTLRSR